MALESFGTETAKNIDNAVKACHDLILSSNQTKAYDPTKVKFLAGEEGIWRVIPSTLNGEPAVEIKLGVG